MSGGYNASELPLTRDAIESTYNYLIESIPTRLKENLDACMRLSFQLGKETGKRELIDEMNEPQEVQ